MRVECRISSVEWRVTSVEWRRPADVVRNPQSEIRNAFTLVELLVTMSILVILMSMTISSYNVSMDSERIRSAARQMQSYLAGARDRAIYLKSPVGVRFILDRGEDINGNGTLDTGEDLNNNSVLDAPSDYTVVSSMIFIGVPESSSGSSEPFWVRRANANSDPVILHGEDLNNDGTLDPGEDIDLDNEIDSPGWVNLYQRGLIGKGSRIKLAGSWYTITDVSQLAAGFEQMTIDPPFRDPVDDPLDPLSAFKVENKNSELILSPTILPNEEPVQLPRGIVIDLNRSKTPASFKSGSSYVNQMDIVFSPRGNITGTAASQGVVHFLLADIIDTDRNLPAVNLDLNGNGQLDEIETNQGDKIIVTVFTRTGHISTSPVFINPNSTTGIDASNDPFRFAETGEVAK